MKFTALTLLALGASASAFVVPANKQVQDTGVEARMPTSGPVRASNLVAALAGRDIVARHHRVSFSIIPLFVHIHGTNTI